MSKKLITTLSDSEKLELINQHLPIDEAKSLEDKMFCLHCDKQFTLRDARVLEDKSGLFSDGMSLECGTPDCNGTPIDWAFEAWWR